MAARYSAKVGAVLLPLPLNQTLSLNLMASSISQSWNQITAWLRAHAPSHEVQLSAPADNEAIAHASSVIGVTLPEDLVELYRQLNGAEACAVFPSPDDYDMMAFTPMSLEEIIAEWSSMKELVDIGQFDDCSPKSPPEIADVWWSPAWIPFATNVGGDTLCIDSGPTESGCPGQVIYHPHESGQHLLLAPSLANYLSSLCQQLESGDFVYDDTKYGVVPYSAPEEKVEKVAREDLFTGMTDWHYGTALELAEKAFKDKKYSLYVAYLQRFADRLDKLPASRLAYAQKKAREER